MIVAITGANGVVGSIITQHLDSQNITTRKIVRPETDVLDVAGLVKAFEGADVVVHAAGFVSFNPRNRQQLYDVNVQGTRNVVNCCLASGVKKLIHISSVAALERSVTDYGYSKYLAELEVYRGMEEGLQVSLVNPSVVLAAGDGRRSSSALFGYVWQQRRFYTDFNLNYVDARDVADIVTRLIHENHNGQKFIASAGTVALGTVLQEIALRLKKRAPSINVPIGLAIAAAGFEEIRAAVTRSEPMVTRQSARALREKLIFENEKAKRELGIKFQSLDKTLDWCCNNYRNILGVL